MTSIEAIEFIVDRPEVIWILALTGAVCVVGFVDYLRCFFEKRKGAIRWVVLFLSLFVACILFTPILPAWIAKLIIAWLLITSLATIGKKHIIDGIGKLIDGVINKLTSVSTKEN